MNPVDTAIAHLYLLDIALCIIALGLIRILGS
jgi:hypothetical protein